MQMDAVKAVGEYFGDSSRNQKTAKGQTVLQGILGGISNVNQMQGYGKLTGKEYAQALFDGFNQGSGVDLAGLGTGFNLPGEMFDFKGFNAFQGIGGTKMSIDAEGNMTIQGFGAML